MAETSLWSGRKRAIFGLPWTFTKYRLTETCLYITTGVFNVREEEIRLSRVLDITLRQSFGERLFGLGTIHLCTSDQTAPEIDIKRIRHPKEVRTLLSDRAEEERSEKLEGMREMIGQASAGQQMPGQTEHL